MVDYHRPYARVPQLEPYQWPDTAAIEKNALINLKLKQELADVPEEKDWARQERAMKTQKFGWEEDVHQREREKRPMKDESEALDYLVKVAPLISWPNYSQSRQHLIDVNKINPAVLPEPDYFLQQPDPQNLFFWCACSTCQRT